MLRWLLQSQAQHRPQSAGEVLQRLGTTMAVPLSAMNPSSQQQTVILDTAARRPDTVDLSGIRSIPSKLVEPMRLRLEALVGARATQILFQAIRSARNAQELVAGLGEQLANDPLRDQALAAITQLLVEGTRTTAGEAAVAAAPRATPQTASRSPVILKDEESSNLLSNELAKYIGPIARMLLKKRLAKATSIDELISQLEHEIPVDSDRVAFRKAVRTMKLLPS